MKVSAKVEYAVRALLVLADAPGLLRIDAIVAGQRLPVKFVEGILSDLRRAGIVRTQRGVHGGYCLARPASEVTVGAVLRAVDGPLATVHGQSPDATAYPGAAVHLPAVWVAVRASLRDVLDDVSLADVLAGRLPAHVKRLAATDAAWRAVPTGRAPAVGSGSQLNSD